MDVPLSTFGTYTIDFIGVLLDGPLATLVSCQNVVFFGDNLIR